MSIYTDYNVLNINTITKLTESINNDFSLLGKPYNKVEKYIDSNNIYSFNVDFLLNKTEKYELFKQVSKDYFWIEFLLERFELTNPVENTSTTIKVKKIIFDISTNNETFIKLTDEDGLNFVSKIISVDNLDTNFTILTIDNDITLFNLNLSKNYFLSLVKLVYLDQKGIQFNLVNDEIYKSKIKVKSTIGVIDTIEIFPSPIIETIDLDTTTKVKAVSGDRILTGRFTRYSYSNYYDLVTTFRENYKIEQKSIEIGNNIFTFTPKSFISGTDLNINLRLMIFNKLTSVEFSEVIFNDFLPFNEVYSEKIDTFHVYYDNTNIFVLIRINNKVVIHKLDKNGVLVSNNFGNGTYQFNTNIDDFERLKWDSGAEYGVRPYLLLENQQEDHESLLVENGNPILYKWILDKRIKYTFNLDNKSYSSSSTNESFKYIESNVPEKDRFFNVKTQNIIYSNGNFDSLTYIFYTPTVNSKIYLKIVSNRYNNVLFDSQVFDVNVENIGYMFNNYSRGPISVLMKDDIFYISMQSFNSSKSTKITLKIENIFNIYVNNVVTVLKDSVPDGNPFEGSTNQRVLENDSVLKNFTCCTSQNISKYDDYLYRRIIFEKSDFDGSNKTTFYIDTEIDELNGLITYTELEILEEPYVQPSNEISGGITIPYIQNSMNFGYNSEVFEIDNNQILFVVPLMKNVENYTFLYVIFDVNFTLVSKLYI